MLSRFHRNSVMHGCIDYFCLACEAVLRTEEDVNSHIDKPVHKKNLAKTKYVESCPDDCIRKVNKGYYCECCNLLLANMIKINLHIKEEKHEFNKTDESEGDIKKNVFLKWVKNAVIAFDDLLINEKAWNGFIDNTCIVCGDEFDDAEIHKSGTLHNLKLIQAKVQVGSDNFMFRKIDESTYQCLTCNLVISPNEMVTHFDKSEHTKLYIQCRKAKRALINSIHTELKTADDKKPDKEPFVFTADSKSETKKEVKQQQTTGEAKRNQKSKELKKDTKPVEPKTDSQSVEAKKHKESPKLRKWFSADINPVLGLKDYIQIFAGDGKALCFLCDWSIDRCKVKQHVNGEHHQTILKLQNDRTEKMKKKHEAKQNAEIATNGVDTKKEVETLQENENNREKIIDLISIFQKNGVRIDLIADKAYCTKCSDNIDFVLNVIEKHIEGHKNSVTKGTGEKYPVVDQNHNKTDIKKPEEAKTEAAKANKPDLSDKIVPTDDEKAIATFTKQHEITFNKDQDFAFCRICEKKVPSSMKCMRQHVSGNNHQMKKRTRNEKAKKSKEERPDSPLYRTKPMEEFIENLTHIENIFKHDVVINDEICISVLSFAMLTRVEGNRFRCQCCEQSLTSSEINDHNRTGKHERALQGTPVLYTLDSEFVREVRPGIFHCGFCNLIEADYDNLELHLLSSAHERSKTAAEWSLEQHMPSIRLHRIKERQELEFAIVMRMLMGGHPFI